MLLTAAAIAPSVLACCGLPERWAGLLAGFPFTLCPPRARFGRGPGTMATTIEHYPVVLGSLMVYAMVVALSYEPPGIYRGTVLSFAAAKLCLAAFVSLRIRWLRHLARRSTR